MILGKQKGNYDVYAKVYDAAKGDRSEVIGLLQYLIEKYRPDAKTLLDLACGTGGIAQGLADQFTIVGVDNAPEMLRIARRKVPTMQLVEANMVDFHVPQKFDVAYCLHNAVNHLLTFEEWESMFSNVAAHLNKGGLFIFDVNLIERLDKMTASGETIIRADDDQIISWVTKDSKRDGLYSWNMDLLLKRRWGGFRHHHESIKVSSYPEVQIRDALMKNFTIAEFFVREYAGSLDENDRAYYVCIKK